MKNQNTQEFFNMFLKRVPSSYAMKGFYSDGALFLTDDVDLYRAMLGKEKARNRQIAAEKKARGEKFYPKFEIFNTLGLRLNGQANLPIRFGYNNSLYARQQLIEDFDVTLGGNEVFVATQNPDRLKDFIGPIIERHIDEFGISLESIDLYKMYYDHVPCLYINGTVNDERLFDNDYAAIFDTKHALKFGVSNLSYRINNTIREQTKTNSDGEGK